MMLTLASTQFVDAPEDIPLINSPEFAMLAALLLNTTTHYLVNAKTALLLLLVVELMKVDSFLFVVAKTDIPKMMLTWFAISVLQPNTMTLASENVWPALDKLLAAELETDNCPFADAQEVTPLTLPINIVTNHAHQPNIMIPHN